MAVPIGNLIRRIDHVLDHEKPDAATAFHNKRIRKAFDDLQPYVHDAERMRDLHDRKWRRPIKVDNKRLKLYREIAKWVSRVADLATDVYDIIISYTWHGNTKGSFSCTDLFIPRLFSVKSEDVSVKIQRFLGLISEYQSSSSSQNRSSRDESKQEKVPLLAESRKGMTLEERLPVSTSNTNAEDPEVSPQLQRSQHQTSWDKRSWFSNITLKPDLGAPPYAQRQSKSHPGIGRCRTQMDA